MENTPRYYAGIGARNTPELVLGQMFKIASVMTKTFNFTLRSGGAGGADTAFEKGCDSANGLKNIYLPWDGFNGRGESFTQVNTAAMEIAAIHHPNWNACSQAARKLHARNAFQILGSDLKTPAELVICYTAEGKITGGTGQALRMAKFYKVPVVNLFGLSPSDIENQLNEIIHLGD